MNAIETNKILAALSACYQNFQVHDVSTEVWMQVLEGVSYEEAKRAALRLMKSGSAFAPAPGQLLEIINEARAARYREEERQRQIERDNYRPPVLVSSDGKPKKARDLLSPELLEKFLKMTKGAKPDA